MSTLEALVWSIESLGVLAVVAMLVRQAHLERTGRDLLWNWRS